jgi:GNAT superfamily N-acetyltransferase
MIDILKLAQVPEVAPECARWLFNEWGHRRPGSTLEDATERFLARANTSNLPIAFVAMHGMEVVGTASLLATEDTPPSIGPWVSSIFVSPKMRGRGIARTLVQAVEAQAMQLGFRHIWLSASAPDMYQKLGYAHTDATKHGEPIMIKELPAS